MIDTKKDLIVGTVISLIGLGVVALALAFKGILWDFLPLILIVFFVSWYIYPFAPDADRKLGGEKP
jgi:predicted RND superfamily exporter protein